MAQRVMHNWRSDRQIRLSKSYKDGGEYKWGESHLESMAQRNFEYDLDVLSYKTQPKEYRYIDDKGVTRFYTPDTEVDTTKGPKNVETKPAIFTKGKRAVERFNHLRLCFSEAGKAPLSYITDEDVYQGEQVANLQKIHHYHRLSIDHICMDGVICAVGTNPTFGELSQHMKSLGYPKKQTLALLGHQKFIFDYKESLTEKTQLTLGVH
ncbi:MULTISPECIES: hypothetical protein [Colwelliaceae]|uniref:TnsA endonuclease N-terminal domain-containing protein n=2 Tax=Colwelliaceae TaxID=267889 RepID=A0A7X0NET7_9GAMM|nr:MULTISPECIES: hypothetical protein [Colwelliaceae]MBB6541986.1 hypothetical protein [Thalassotalea piscium]SEL87113.1 hypothetical protein SAMN05216262_1284 [Colwellia chukchiensis]